MMKSREKERFQNLRFIGTGYNSANQNILLNVTTAGRIMIEYDPNVYPAVGSFVLIELSAVNRKHEYWITFLDATILYGLEILATMEKIIIARYVTIVLAEFLQYFLSANIMVTHSLCAILVAPKGLQLRADWHRMEFSVSDLGFTITSC